MRGKTPEEIERFIPKTVEERRKYVADQSNNLVKMKEDIAFLLNEVHELRELVGGGGKNATRRTTAKKVVDDGPGEATK